MTKWIQAFYNMGNYSAVMGAEPGRFVFNGNIARVSIRGDQAQMVVNHFKNWLPQASSVLRNRLEDAEEQRQRALYNQLQREKQIEEENLRVNRALKI